MTRTGQKFSTRLQPFKVAKGTRHCKHLCFPCQGYRDWQPVSILWKKNKLLIVKSLAYHTASSVQFHYITCTSDPVVSNAHLRILRSARDSKLFVSRMWTNLGDRAFSAAEARVWNYLPTDLRQPDLTVCQENAGNTKRPTDPSCKKLGAAPGTLLQGPTVRPLRKWLSWWTPKFIVYKSVQP